MNDNAYNVVKSAYDTIVEVGKRVDGKEEVDLSYASGLLTGLLTIYKGEELDEEKRGLFDRIIH